MGENWYKDLSNVEVIEGLNKTKQFIYCQVRVWLIIKTIQKSRKSFSLDNVN